MSISRAKTALKRMREQTHAGVPFSFSYLSYNETKGTSSGVKHVAKAILRKGYHKDQSDKSELLVAYKDINTGKQRQFYLPLLIKYEGICLK